MTIRRHLALAVLAMLCLALSGVAATTGYGGPAPYLVKVTGPSRAVDCGQTVTLTATVRATENGKPIKNQYVQWSIAAGAAGDQLSSTRSKTDANGQATVDLTIAKAIGDRRVAGDAGGVVARALVKVTCVVPTPAPTPRPTATPTPEPTPRPTPKPTRKPSDTPAPSTSPAPSASAGALERDTLTVGYREQDLPGRAPLVLADSQGRWADAGLTSVTQVFAADPLPGILDGSLDVAVMRLDDALKAIAAGRPIRILAGYHQLQSDIVAVADGVGDVSALTGQPIIVGDDERAPIRIAALADAGWDLSTAGAKETLPDGGVDAWVAAFIAGDVKMTPLLNRHRLLVDFAQGSLALDRQVYGDDVLVTSSALVESAPRTLTAFLTGTIEALHQLPDPATDELLFTAAQAAGITIDAGVRGGWLNDMSDFRPWDGSLGDPSAGNGLGELDAFAQALLGWVPIPADHLALPLLHDAQIAAGLAPTPVLPELATPGTPLRIGTTSTDLALRAPLLLALADGAFAAAGHPDTQLVLIDGPGAVVDGTVDLAIVSEAEAGSALTAGDPVIAVAGYQPAAAAPSVILARNDRPTADLAPALTAVLRGLAALNLPDAMDRAITQSGEAAPADAAATWPATVAAFAPFDGTMSTSTNGAHPALTAARAALGLVDPEPAP